MKTRSLLRDNPMMGWLVASILALVAAVMLYRQFGTKSETAQLTELVTIRDSETSETWQVPRGVMEKELYMRSYPVSLTQGLFNPNTGKANGFPIDDWKVTVERINSERKDLAEQGPAPTPTNPTE